MRPRTRLIHGGKPGDPQTGAVNVPIHLSATFRQDGPGEHRGYEYARTGNPTRHALEALVADLEGGTAGFAFASGMAALTTILLMFRAGDHVVCSDDVYGGTYRLLVRVLSRLGLEAIFVDTGDLDAVERAVTGHERTVAVLVETPTNPLMKITDLEAISRAARGWPGRPLVIVDNTFLSPYLQRPLDLGADVVWHSATKYLSGHSDLVAGVVAVRDPDLARQLAFLQNAAGAVLGVQDAWLLIRGIRTLGVRMEAHEQNARRVAGWLATHPRVRRVYYPGLPDHPGHAVAARQAAGFGGMLSFECASAALADAALRRLRWFTLAESLGGVESLACLPARMTHASVPPERRAALGISDALVRLSVGIEDPDDLVEDLDQALRA